MHDFDARRLAAGTLVGTSFGAFLDSPEMQIIGAMLASAVASVLVDVIRAAGRWAVKRLAPEVLEKANEPPRDPPPPSSYQGPHDPA